MTRREEQLAELEYQIARKKYCTVGPVGWMPVYVARRELPPLRYDVPRRWRWRLYRAECWAYFLLTGRLYFLVALVGSLKRQARQELRYRLRND